MCRGTETPLFEVMMIEAREEFRWSGFGGRIKFGFA